MTDKAFLRRIFACFLTGTTLTICLSLSSCSSKSPDENLALASDANASISEATAITSLGRLEPQGDVIKLSVAFAQDSRVDKLFVTEGDRVKAGQVIAILQGMNKRKAALGEAEENLAVNQTKLLKIKAGDAKEAEIAAQKAKIAQIEAQMRTGIIQKQAEIARTEAELRNARISYQRYQSLYRQGAIKTEDLDNRQEKAETAIARLNEAKAQLDNTRSTLREQILQEKAALAKLKEVRPIDVQVAQSEVNYAKTQIDRAKAELDDIYVRVPVDGRILKINTRIGEQVSTSQGIVELGRTDEMYAIAEVYETDVARVKLGQRAEIVSENGGFAGKLKGTVKQIGLQIKKKDVLDSDPTTEKDARVVEVKVKIDANDNHKVESFTNMQVRVAIDLMPPSGQGTGNREQGTGKSQN
jgi:HlyD family secretion protein